jgi:DHA1 family multidrug resistance protein-like MFS transporter
MLRNRTLVAIALSVCAAYTGIGMVGPVRVLFAQSHGASLAIIGAMASAYLVSNFVFQYPSGWLADRWGRKQVMVLGLFVQALLSLLYLLIADPILFIALRFIEGMAAAAILPSARAMIIDVVPAEKQGEAFGFFGAFFNAGFLLGPGLGGLLATTGYASAFIGAALFRLIAIVIVITMLPAVRKNTSIARDEDAGPPISYRTLFALPLLGAYILAFGDYLYLGFDLTLLPLWMHDHLGASVAIIGLAYMAWAIPNIIFSTVGGRLADRVRRSLMIAIFGLAQVPLYFLYGVTTMAIFVVVLFAVHGLFYAFIQPAVDAHLAASSRSTMRARVQGMYSTIGLIGAFFGANVFSPLYAINYRLPLFTMGTLFGLCVILGSTLVRISEARTTLVDPLKEETNFS